MTPFDVERPASRGSVGRGTRAPDCTEPQGREGLSDLVLLRGFAAPCHSQVRRRTAGGARADAAAQMRSGT
jgi:hypothetical protein